jgi:hypothetical protein
MCGWFWLTKQQAIINIIRSCEYFAVEAGGQQTQVRGVCDTCGYMSSQRVCKACVLLEGLNKGTARLAVGKDRHSGQARRAHEANRAAMAKRFPDQHTATASELVAADRSAMARNPASSVSSHCDGRDHTCGSSQCACASIPSVLSATNSVPSGPGACRSRATAAAAAAADPLRHAKLSQQYELITSPADREDP